MGPQSCVLSVNGQKLQAPAHTQSLLEFLRQEGVKSVKQGCGEGGCGACAVLVTTRGADGHVSTRSVNSCLVPVFSVDGSEVTTAEGLPRNAEGQNPVAERLAGFYASQCGFCTPGMAVACHATLAKAAQQGCSPTAEQLRDGLDGNLCRCTGYRPIVDACKSFAHDVDMEDLGLNTFACNNKPLPAPAQAAAAATGAAADAPAVQSEDTAAVPPPKVLVAGEGKQTVYVPHDLQQLEQVVRQLTSQGTPMRLVAGNTSVGVYKDWPLQDPALLYIMKVRELQGVQAVDAPQPLPGSTAIRIGAAATLSDLIDQLSVWSNLQEPGKVPSAVVAVAGVWSELATHLKRVAGSHVRGAATLAGNLVLSRTRGLPSDVATLMMAAGAYVEVVDLVASAACTPQLMPVTEYITQQGAESNHLQLVTAVLVPVPPAGSRFWSTRIAPRWSNAVSTLNAAARLIPAGPDSQSQAPAATFVLGMNLEHTPGPEQWRVGHCTTLEAALQHAIPGAGLTPDTAMAVLSALSQDLSTMFGLAGDSYTSAADGNGNAASANGSTAAATASGPGEHMKQQHFAYLRSASEGLLLQALAALLGDKQQEPPARPAVNGRAHEQAAAEPVEGDASVNHSSRTSGSGDDLVVRLDALEVATAGDPHQQQQRVLRSAAKLPAPHVISGHQDLLEPDAAYAPLTHSLPKESSLRQAEGTAQYSDDVLEAKGALYAAWVTSTVARGTVRSIDTHEALAVAGAVRFVGPQDVPGLNHPPMGEPIFATDVEYHGQAVGLMLATSYQAAQLAASLVRVEYDAPAQPAVLDAATALAQAAVYDIQGTYMKDKAAGSIKGSVRLGAEDVSEQLAAAPLQLKGVRWHLPSQGHMYMEPQTAVAEVDEDQCVRVHASTQFADKTMATVALALNLPHNKVEVRCRRLGGGFGGKAQHPSRVAAAAAVAAVATGKQVRLATARTTDMAMFGGRCPTDISFDVGFDEDGRLLAVDLNCIMQAGAYMNLGWLDIAGAATVPDNVYHIPALKVQYTLLKLNIPPRTAVRAPGDFTGVMAMERVIECVAAHLGLDPALVRERNMRQPVPGSPLSNSVGKPLGPGEQCSLPRIWQEIKDSTGYQERVRAVEEFNAANIWRKRGLSLVPCMYPLMGGTHSAMVHIYVDGSVRVQHPGVDMGQGLGIKVLQTAAYELSKVLPSSQRPLPLHLLRPADISTYALPHSSLTAGSTTSDVACSAVRVACAELASRLQPHAEKLGEECTWQGLIKSMFHMPGIRGKATMTAVGDSDMAPKGMFSYATYGAALAEAELDVLTGDRRVLSVDILFDCGKSLNPGVDLGQVEGAFVFGMGLLLSEHVEHDPETGACTTASTWRYKIPSTTCVPERLNVAMLKDSPMVMQAPLGAKAVGEPPLLLSCSVPFALAAAARAAAAQTYGISLPATTPLPLPALPPHLKLWSGGAAKPLQQVLSQHLGSTAAVAKAKANA